MTAGLVFSTALVVFLIAAIVKWFELAKWEQTFPPSDDGPPVALYALVVSLFVMFLCVLWWIYQWLAWLQEIVAL